MHLEADISRLTSITGWTPQVPLAEGLRQTVEWFREQ
jgi:nucleoside-diphosphate-sugar epimerase